MQSRAAWRGKLTNQNRKGMDLSRRPGFYPVKFARRLCRRGSLCICAQHSGTPQKFADRRLDRRPLRLFGSRAPDKDNIERAFTQIRQAQAQGFPQSALNAIAHDGVSQLFTDDKADTSPRSCVGMVPVSPQDIDHRKAVGMGAASRIDQAKVSVFT